MQRIRFSDDALIYVFPVAEADLLAVVTALLARRAASEAALAPRWRGVFGELMDGLEAARGAVEAPAVEAQVEPAFLTAEALAPLLAFASEVSLRTPHLLNNVIDGAVGAVEQRAQSAVSGLDPEGQPHGEAILQGVFEGGKAFLSLKGRQQWAEVRRRFANPSPKVVAALEALGLTRSVAGINALNEHYGRLLGLEDAGGAPEAEAAGPGEVAAQEALRALVLLANLAAPGEEDGGLRTQLLGPWLDVQREYRAARRR